MREPSKSVIRVLQTRRIQTIEKIKESFSENEALKHYKDFKIGLIGMATRLKSKGYDNRENIESFIETLRQVTAEAARRVSTPGQRIILSRQPQQFAEEFGIKKDEMMLPLYEEDTGELKKIDTRDKKLLGGFIRSICTAIVETSVYRADGGFTRFDLYSRTPEASFLIEPFLSELERTGFLVSQSIPYEDPKEKSKSEIIYLIKRWASANAMFNDVMSKLNGNAKMPYRVLRIMKGNKRYIEKWERDCLR